MYLRKIFKHGNVIEDCKYKNGRYGVKTKNSPPTGSTPAEQKAWQKKNDERKVWRLIDDNFYPGDLWTTLTYPANSRPPSETVRKNIQTFLKRLRRLYKKEGIPLKYIYSVGRGKRGAVHMHMIIPKFDLDKIRDLWADIVNHGAYVRTNFQPLDKSRDYGKLAAYVIKNSEEDFQSGDPVFRKRYCTSTNLKQQKPKAQVIKAKEWKKEPPERPGYYIDKERSYAGLNVFGYPVQYTVYVKLDGEKPPETKLPNKAVGNWHTLQKRLFG